MSKGKLTAHSSARRMVLLIIASVAFVAAGLWMVGLFGRMPGNNNREEAELTLVGWLTIIFFGYCAFVWIRRAFDPDAQLVVSVKGIYWKPWSKQTIPWHEISDISVWEYRRQKAITLALKDPQKCPGGTMSGKLGFANRWLAGGDVSISVTGLDKSLEEVLAAIEQFRPSK